MTIEIKGKADPKGKQDFWCKKILTGGRKCGEPFPDHFNGRINDHDFYPLAKLDKITIKKLKAIKKFNLKEKKIKNDMSGICDYCGKEIDETEIFNECPKNPKSKSRRKKN